MVSRRVCSRPPTEVRFPRSGCLWMIHTGPRVEAFDVLCVVMNELSMADIGL